MPVISTVVYHAFNNPLIVNSWVQIASKYFCIESWKVSEKDYFMGVFYLCLNILNYYDINFNKFKHLHRAFEIRDKIDRLIVSAVYVDFSIAMCQLFMLEIASYYHNMFAAYILVGSECIDFDRFR